MKEEGIKTTHGNGHQQESGPARQGEATQENKQAQALAFRLREAIDQRGKYSYRLNDMAAGYAAGQNVSHTAARRAVENTFKEQFGKTPKEYLNEQFQERDRAGYSRAFSRDR